MSLKHFFLTLPKGIPNPSDNRPFTDCTGWNQIFFEVDRSSRGGFLKLAFVKPGRYTSVVPTEGKFCTPRSEDAPVRPPVPARPRQDTQWRALRRSDGLGGVRRLQRRASCPNFSGGLG
jgi:hypothetical protein